MQNFAIDFLSLPLFGNKSMNLNTRATMIFPHAAQNGLDFKMNKIFSVFTAVARIFVCFHLEQTKAAKVVIRRKHEVYSANHADILRKFDKK